MIRRPPRSTRPDTLFPDTTLFRSDELRAQHSQLAVRRVIEHHLVADFRFEATEHDLARLLESRGAYGLSNGDAGSLGYQQQGSGEQLAFNRHIPALECGGGMSEIGRANV